VTVPGCRVCLGQWPPAEQEIADCGSTVAYLEVDQFFPGWTVLVLKRHATELFELSREERAGLIEEVNAVAAALAAVFRAVKVNYALLGNQVPHIHWHVVPRLAGDPIPTEPVWVHRHDRRPLSPADRDTRIEAIRRHLRR
jgi:diadenosine tetraphosphate (Ap4A) HIT family hydrolase